MHNFLCFDYANFLFQDNRPMKKLNILFIAVMLMGTGFPQYLTYTELIGLLNIAHDDMKVDEYLVNKGFEYSNNSSTEGVKLYSYQKIIGKDLYKGLYSITVYYDGVKVTSVSESSSNVERWKYYKSVVQNNGYKLIETIPDPDGALWIHYQKDKYQLIMVRDIDEYGPRYQIVLQLIKY